MADARHSLAGKVAIVTGAAKGMGAEMSAALAEAGAKVAGIDNDAPSLRSHAAKLATVTGGGAFLPIEADISVIGSCRTAVDRVVAAFGGIDILVNNAAVGMTVVRPAGHKGPLRFWEGDPEGWQRLMTINNGGAYFMARFATPVILSRGWGRIITITTNYDTMLSANRFGYGPAKAALEAGTAIWAKELAGSGVTVNALLPGRQVNTTVFPPEMPRDGMLDPSIMRVPICWLASPASDGIHGLRFIAEHWDGSLSAAGIRERGTPLAWPQLGRQTR